MKKTIFNLSLAALSLLAAGCVVSGENETMYASEPNIYGKSYEAGEDLPSSGDKFGEFADNPFVKTSMQPVSTFSVDADGASYAIVRRYLNSGYEVNPSSVRIEELLNYFTFDYASPTDGNHVAINAEVGYCPWNTEHFLLRLGIKGKELTEAEMPRANFVFLVDVSGSMATNDKLFLLKAGLRELVSNMNPDDRISIVTYSGEVKKVLESTLVKDAPTIIQAIDLLNASGSTNGGEALKMAYEEALENYDPKANNRIILGTDGDFNVGVTSTEALTEMVESYAKRGIYMTCLGFGMGNLNDAMMESISNHGNGTYHYIDSEDEMTKVFIHERERFVSVANDAKCQVTFSPDIVSEYRLIGYENRVMSHEDFENDEKDAGEIGAGQTITALYELVLNADYSPLTSKPSHPGTPFATFDFRYKKSLDGESIPLQRVLTMDDIFSQSNCTNDFYFAAGVAAFGMTLRQSPYKANASLAMARMLVEENIGKDPHGYRAQLLQLINSQCKISRKGVNE